MQGKATQTSFRSEPAQSKNKTSDSCQGVRRGLGSGEGGVGVSPLPHSKPRKRLQAWGPSQRPLVSTCCMQNTVRWGEEKNRRKCAYSRNGDKAQACQESLEEVTIQRQERGRSGCPPAQRRCGGPLVTAQASVKWAFWEQEELEAL